PGVELHNLYGPTEAAIDVTAWACRASDGAAPPIGGPIWNTRAYVLDGGLEPVAVGVGGEVYVSGAGLAVGGLGRAGLAGGRGAGGGGGGGGGAGGGSGGGGGGRECWSSWAGPTSR